jgi:hypothetical protein
MELCVAQAGGLRVATRPPSPEELEVAGAEVEGACEDEVDAGGVDSRG